MPARKRKSTSPSPGRSQNKSPKVQDCGDVPKLTAIQKNISAHELLAIVRSKGDFASILANLSEVRKLEIWSSCHVLIAESILAILQKTTEDDIGRVESTVDNCIAIAKSLLEAETSPDLIEEMEKSVFLFHESMPSLMNVSLSNHIAKLCEIWYVKNLPNKESMSLNAVEFLLRKTAQPSGTKSDIKKIYSMTANNATFTAKLIEDSKLKSRVLVALQSPTFYRSHEGQRFIVSLFFTNQASLIKDIHKSFKAVLPGCSRQDASHIGEIYFKAWSNGTETEIIEEQLQDFMYHCVLANKKAKLFDPLLALLAPFHMAKNNKKAQATVHKLWEPLLWRHLRVANSDVRCNAIQILTEAFPIEDPEADLELKATHQEAQIQAFHDLLKDEVPEVRIAAINGAVTILSRFWLIFEASQVQKLMLIIVKTLANDMSSPKVRQTVIKGMAALVKTCPRCHLYMKKILPKLKDGLYDSNESVRLAMIDLLIAVKAVKSIQYWTICPLTDLLDQLAKDKKPVAQRIASLLFNSFFPLEQNEEAKLERCVYLIKTNIEASRRFYLLIDRLVNLHGIVKFMLGILVNLKKHCQVDCEDTEDKENVSANAGDQIEASTLKDGSIKLANDSLHQSLSDTFVVGGLVDVVCILWMARCKELSSKDNAEYRALLEKKSSKILTLLFKVYKSSQVHRSVIYLSSFLPHSASLTMASFCLSRLKSATEPELISKYPGWAEDPKLELSETTFTTYADALCNWKRGDDILDMIGQWLKKDLQERSTKLKDKPRKGVRFDEKPRPGYGLILLRYLLSHTINRSILVKKNIKQLEDAKLILKGYLPFMDKALEVDEDEGAHLEGHLEVLGSAWTAYLQMEVFLHMAQKTDEHEDIMLLVTNLMSWCQNKIMGKKSLLADHIVSNVLMMTSNLVTLNIVCQDSYIQKFIQISHDMITEDTGCERVKIFLPLMTEIAQWLSCHKECSTQLLSQMFSKVCTCLHQGGNLSKEIYLDAKKHLALFLSISLTSFETKSEVVDTLSKSMLTSFEFHINEKEIIDAPERNSSSYLFCELCCDKKTLKSIIPCLIQAMKIDSTIKALACHLLFAYVASHLVKTTSAKHQFKELIQEIEINVESVEDTENHELRGSFNEMLLKAKTRI